MAFTFILDHDWSRSPREADTTKQVITQSLREAREDCRRWREQSGRRWHDGGGRMTENVIQALACHMVLSYMKYEYEARRSIELYELGDIKYKDLVGGGVSPYKTL